MPIRVLLADDHVIVRQGIGTLLQTHGFNVLGEASTGHEAVALNRRLHADVAVLDISMPLLNGVDAAREILREHASTKVLFLTMFAEQHYVIEGLRIGISGYVLKTKAAEELVQAIQIVHRGGTYLSVGLSEMSVQAFMSGSQSPDPLTIRERQVLQLVAEGKTTKEIAVLLGISTKTAESHRTNIMGKLNIHETAGLVRYAIRHHIIAG